MLPRYRNEDQVQEASSAASFKFKKNFLPKIKDAIGVSHPIEHGYPGNIETNLIQIGMVLSDL